MGSGRTWTESWKVWKGMGEYLKLKIKEVARHHPEIAIHEVNTDQDHAHILISIAPKMAISEAVKIIKANTARHMREKFPFLDKVYWGSSGIWSIGYFVSTVGLNEETIRRYIEHQGQEDSGQATLELG
jgi:putative transposase